ncbi:GtrA family protein [Amycolatopsis sp. SID8362]|uniref:GtrA family protein n=1 Tax=Amycolatopsis sp. SID8362 TaxID=2690346 RepID=UPI00136D893F|nr:GtrA family protein [Amycolatopsis sp. SID8362]NBH11360.1 GtrA family protein [Amycolatopsis sp. SID8362]NED48052.1 GtrA family protein [Amycolatopsis sp. SID8362]
MTTVTNGVRPRTTEKTRRRGWARLARAAATSVAATVLSQVVLLAVLATGGAAALASTLAWAAGAVLNFLVTRRWVWGRTGRPRVRRELLPYLAVIGLGGLASIGLTTLAGSLLAPLELPHFWWIVLVDGAYVGSYALVFVVKFTLLDRLVFARGAARTPATTSRS